MPRRYLLLKFAQRYPLRASLTVVLGFSGAFFNGISTALIVPVILSLIGQELNVDNAPSFIKALIGPFNAVHPSYRLAMMTGAILLAIGLKNLMSYANTLTGSALKQRLTSDLREEALQMLLDVDIDYFHKLGIGDILNRVNNEVGRAATALNAALKIITNSVTVLIFVGLLIAISWQLTAVASVLLLFVISLNQLFIKRSKIFGKLLSEASKSYSMRLTEALTGMRLIKEVTSEDREYATLTQLIRQREKIEFQAQANTAAIAPMSEMAGIVAIIGIVIFGRMFFVDQLATVATVLLTYLVVLFRLLPVLSQLNASRSLFANLSASVDIVADFLRRQDKPFMNNGAIPFLGVQNDITFENISFAYPESDRLSLQNVSLTLPKGSTLALVGASGAGKSTLADLLPRFYDATRGCIKIDGQELQTFDVRSLRRAIAVVSQESFLFNDSIRNNIAYARPDANDDEIIEALKRANAYEFVSKLSHGLDTQIGDRGVMLSGGQRQRLSIARALLKHAEILILDEATSALDTVSEKLVQAAIDDLSRECTSIVIAHRLSTIQNADQIAVLEKGEVVEVGSHQELLTRGHYYAQLYANQFTNSSSPEMNNMAIVSSLRTVLNERFAPTRNGSTVTDDDCHQQSFSSTSHINSMSHRMRNNLNSMLGSLSLVMDDIEDTSDENHTLLVEAYDSALVVLQSLEGLEKNHYQNRYQ
ncbi:MAG: ABC transporter ATP-binding protein [Cyanobacteria bacterium P01_A01_bin.37]